jgi:hypothetical protein
VRESVTSRTELDFTRNLVWEPVPVSGRHVRITEEDADRFEEIQARRVFGDAEVRHFAVVNPLYPDARKPSVIAREWTDSKGVRHSECYGPDRTWIPTGTITHIRHGFCDGMLTPVTAETAARLHDSDWTGTREFLSGKRHPVEVDRARADKYVKIAKRSNSERVPPDDRWDYFAIVDHREADVLTARALVRSLGGRQGAGYEQKFHPRDNKWRSCLTLYDISSGRDNAEDVPITTEVAERLREVLLARFRRGAG